MAQVFCLFLLVSCCLDACLTCVAMTVIAHGHDRWAKYSQGRRSSWSWPVLEIGLTARGNGSPWQVVATPMENRRCMEYAWFANDLLKYWVWFFILKMEWQCESIFGCQKSETSPEFFNKSGVEKRENKKQLGSSLCVVDPLMRQWGYGGIRENEFISTLLIHR